jgi:hypothetical protein
VPSQQCAVARCHWCPSQLRRLCRWTRRWAATSYAYPRQNSRSALSQSRHLADTLSFHPQACVPSYWCVLPPSPTPVATGAGCACAWAVSSVSVSVGYGGVATTKACEPTYGGATTPAPHSGTPRRRDASQEALYCARGTPWGDAGGLKTELSRPRTDHNILRLPQAPTPSSCLGGCFVVSGRAAMHSARHGWEAVGRGHAAWDARPQLSSGEG